MPPDEDERLPRRGAVPSPEYPAKSFKSLAHERNTLVGPTRDEIAERLMELAGQYVQGIVADVEVIVSKAAARAREIPDQPELARQVDAMWTVLGEVLMRVAVLEHDLQERDAERRRKRKR